MSIVITSAVASAVDAAATAAVDDAYVTALGTNSVVEIRTGAAPGPGNTATGTLVASITIASWTAGSPGAGQITSSNPAAVTVSASADLATTDGHFRVKTSGGTAILEGTVGDSGTDLVITPANLVAGGSLDAGALVITIPVTAATS